MMLVLLGNSAVEITVDVSRVLEGEGVLEEGVGEGEGVLEEGVGEGEGVLEGEGVPEEGEGVLLKSSVVCVADCAELKELVVGIGSIVED